MKDMLSKLGTKKVAGAVLAAATLLVGIGVVSNFTGSGTKAANEAALSRFSDNAYNNFSGSAASRAALERQMTAGQDMNTARFLRGGNGISEDDAYSSDGAYAEGVRGDEGFVYGAYSGGAAGASASNGAVAGGAAANANGAYQPFNSTYEQGEGSVNLPSMQGQEYGAEKFQEISQQASAALGVGRGGEVGGLSAVNGGAGGEKGSARGGAKGGDAAVGGKSSGATGKGANGAGQAGALRPATQINKLASSGDSGFSFGGGAGGAKGGGSSSFGGGSGDSNTRALPNGAAGQGQAGAEAFKFGRGGTMGGFNVGMGGTESNTGKGKDRSTANALYLATVYSAKGAASKQEAGAKSLAEAAFDGSDPENIGDTIEAGATIDKVANTLMSANSMNNLPNAMQADMGLKDAVDEIKEKQEELSQLQKDLRSIYWEMILGAVGIALGVYVLAVLARNIVGPWSVVLWIAAAALALVGLAFIFHKLRGFGSVPNDWSLLGKINALNSEDLAPVNENLNWTWKEGLAYGVSGTLAALTGVALAGFGFYAFKSIIVTLGGGGGIGAIAGILGLGGAAVGGGAITESEIRDKKKRKEAEQNNEKDE